MIVFAAYIAVIVLANWALATFGLVPVGFGLVAPAGVYFAGCAYVCRNAVQETLGRRWGFAAILAGQVVGKWETVSIGVALVWWWRWRRRVVSERAPGRKPVALDG